MSSATTVATSTTTATSTWNIDPIHSSAQFKVRHMMISNVKGKFSGITGTLTHDEADPTRSSVEATVPVASLSTGDEQRDTHLKLLLGGRGIVLVSGRTR